MDITQSFPTKYLQKADFAQPKLVTVDTVAMENVALDSQPAEMKPVLYFKGSPKGMILNKTNANICTALWGNMTENWTGRQIVAYDDVTIQYQGKLVGGIRLRPNQEPTREMAQPINHETGNRYIAQPDTRAAENAAQAVQFEDAFEPDADIPF